MVIRIENLTVKYPAHTAPAVKDFSLDVAAGELVFLRGPTGCGKSTVLSVLSGIVPHITLAGVSGRIEIAGLDPRKSTIQEVGREVAHLFQNVETQLFTDRVEDEIMLPLEFGAIAASDPNRMLEESLECFGLQSRRTHTVRTLSSGYKQRLALASLHLSSKTALLLDEPFSYLDPKSASALQEILVSLKRAGLAVLVADHREKLVSPIADRTVPLGDDSPLSMGANPRPLRSSAVNPEPVTARAEGMTFSYDERELLRDVDLEVRRNESVVIVGDNGSGKTTLCLLLAGMLRPQTGQVVVNNVTIHRAKGARRARLVGLVLQNPDRQIFHSRVGDELSDIRGERLLKELGLASLRDHHPRALSFGQKRRLALARILMRAPGLLIVDEPSVGQDTASLTAMAVLLNQYRDTGGSIILTTHDDRVIGLLADRVVRIGEGLRKSREYRN